MPQRTFHFFTFEVFGHGQPGQGATPQESIHDVISHIGGLDENREDENGCIMRLSEGVESDCHIMYITENLKATHSIKGVFALLRKTGLPNTRHRTTGLVGDIDPDEDLLEKSHFYINSETNTLVYQQTQTSPRLSAFINYIRTKAEPLVYTIRCEAHVQRNALNTVLQAIEQNRVRGVLIRIKSSYADRANLLGAGIETAINSLSQTIGAEQITVGIQVKKYDRQGSIILNNMAIGLPRFLGRNAEIGENSEIEKLAFDLHGEEIDLAAKYFTISVTINNIEGRSINSDQIVNAMEAEYIDKWELMA